ncbi:hypothetical protein [Paenibacillus sp. 1P03SA]|uniref:hypothetical protein n=1 Tax=Paenibacillus sp. 1P03SA TaxID=3132294 RepID=UPI0039A1020C
MSFHGGFGPGGFGHGGFGAGGFGHGGFGSPFGFGGFGTPFFNPFFTPFFNPFFTPFFNPFFFRENNQGTTAPYFPGQSTLSYTGASHYTYPVQQTAPQFYSNQL